MEYSDHCTRAMFNYNNSIINVKMGRMSPANYHLVEFLTFFSQHSEDNKREVQMQKAMCSNLVQVWRLLWHFVNRNILRE